MPNEVPEEEEEKGQEIVMIDTSLRNHDKADREVELVMGDGI